MKKLIIIAKYGILGGFLALLSSSTITYLAIELKNEQLFYIGYLVIVIMPICTFLALRDLQLNTYGGGLPFIPSLVLGLTLSFIAFSVFTGLKYMEDFIFEDRYEKYLIEVTKDELNAVGEDEEEINKRVKEIIDRNNSWKPVKNRFKWYMKLGLLYTVLSFLILKYVYPKFYKK